MRLRRRLLKTGALALVIGVFLWILWSINYDRNTKKYGKELLREFYARHKQPRMQVQQNGEFWILQNYIVASEEFGFLDSITYTTHGEFTYLENLEELVKRWSGPISIAIFAPGTDFYKTLHSIDYLHRCSPEKHLIRRLVSFHIIFPSDHMPAFIPKQKSELEEFVVNCEEPPAFSLEPNSTYRHSNSLLYPINVSRNLARKSATTFYIFPCDIELYATINFIEEFLDLIHRMPEFLFAKRRVYPLPVFEVNATEDIPTSKTDLQEMLHTDRAILFHQNICRQCHAIPGIEEWIAQPEQAQLHIFGVAKHHPMWEPFYVTTNEEPFYDERYSWEGRYDKQIQADLLGMMDYDFYILNNAFLVHRPGIKTHSTTNSSEISKMKEKTRLEVLPQLRILYV